MEEEKEIESDRGCIGTSDPIRYDPVFRSRAELKRYFKEDSSDSDPDPGDCGGDDGQVLAGGWPAVVVVKILLARKVGGIDAVRNAVSSGPPSRRRVRRSTVSQTA